MTFTLSAASFLDGGSSALWRVIVGKGFRT
jgi:hypothetical protein